MATTIDDPGRRPEDPRAYIPHDRRRALAAGRELDDRVNGAALFADISGFTPLTELLANELGAERGAEELANTLNRLFEAIIDDLRRHEGEVLYFSGDAITCWLDGDDGLRAAACAIRMQETMAAVGTVTTPGGDTVDMSLKVAVAVGSARRFVVGNPEIQRIDVLAGELIDHLAAAEQLAAKGDVILDESALASLGDRVVIQAQRLDVSSGRMCAIPERLTVDVPQVDPQSGFEAIPDEVARQWVLPTVYARLRTGGGAFFAELRPAFPIFVRFGGIDYDDDPDAIAKLDDFVRQVQEILDRYGGNLLQITVGDKGAYLFAAFGTPTAHEDDAVRCVTAALELRQLDETTHATGLQIGISTGRIFSGTYGHSMRSTFTCLGDAVNLAARLMGHADEGSVLVSDDVVRNTGWRFEWHELPPLVLKGKAEPAIAHRLERAQVEVSRWQQRYTLPMVGREAELDAIDERLKIALQGSVQVLGITAEAGIGKSRLIADVLDRLRDGGHDVIFGDAQAFGRNMSYLVWREAWWSIFGLVDEPESRQIERVVTKLRTIDENLVRRAPLLSTLLGIEIPDNDFTSTFDAKLRKASLENLLIDALRAELAREPLVIVLEDCQWIDQASIDLLEVLIRGCAGLPLFVLLAYRVEIESDTRQRFQQLTTFTELELHDLTRDDMRRVTLAKLTQQFGDSVRPAPEVVELIVERGEGNPFYVEELVNLFRRSGVDVADPAGVRDFGLPDSLHALALSRVDALDEGPRRAGKVASVVGREFDEPTLPGAYPDLGSADEVTVHLHALGDADLVVQDADRYRSWLFRHALSRDVAYESLPFSLRATLHEAVAAYIERREIDALDLNLDLLAYHYWHSDNAEKKIHYLRRAGQSAKASYANAAAIEYFGRLAQVVEPADRAAALRELGEVLELVGDWTRAEEIETEALSLAQVSGDLASVGWSEAALAEVARKQGRFDETTERLERALAAFDSIGNEAGKGRVLHLAGTVYAQQGDLGAAQGKYETSLVIRRALGDQAGEASLLSNMGIVAEYSGDLDASRRFHEQALTVRSALGDRWAIAVSRTNLGMIAVLQDRHGEARDLFDEAMRLNREVGDSWMVAISHNNLGNANRGLGDAATARRHYADGATAYRPYRDRWATAFLLEDIALLAAMEGDAVASLGLLGSADRLRDEIEAPRAAALEKELQKNVADADPTLPGEARDAIRQTGRSRNFDAALDAAIAFCVS